MLVAATVVVPAPVALPSMVVEGVPPTIGGVSVAPGMVAVPSGIVAVVGALSPEAESVGATDSFGPSIPTCCSIEVWATLGSEYTLVTGPRPRPVRAIMLPANVDAAGAAAMRPKIASWASHDRRAHRLAKIADRDLQERPDDLRVELGPAQRVISRRASWIVIGFLYDRVAVITSNTSATATSRPAKEMSLPDNPAG